MALPEYAYKDPSNLIDGMRKAERELAKNCDSCEHQIRAWELTACREDRKPGRDGGCRWWTGKGEEEE